MQTEWPEITQVICAVFTVLISSIGLPLIFWQIYLANKNMKQSYHSSLYSVNAEIIKAFIEHPELRSYFHDNKELDFNNENTKNQVFSIAELFADHFESILLEQKNLSKNVQYPWLNYMTNTYLRSSAFRKFMEFHQDQYSKELQDFLARILIEHKY